MIETVKEIDKKNLLTTLKNCKNENKKDILKNTTEPEMTSLHSSSFTNQSVSSSICSTTSNNNTIPESEYILKVILVGDSGVGKSNLMLRFTKNKYNEISKQTIGFEFTAKTIRVGGKRIKAQIWDTAGQERFQSLTAAYYRNAVGALVVYDITNRSSFENLDKWLKQIRENAHEKLVLILVGNKIDLAHLPNTRQVSTLEAARFAEKNHMDFQEVSALDSTNVIEAFKKIIIPVGRLLTPGNPNTLVRLPPGWRRVISRTRPGEYSYENQYTKERIAFTPLEPAKPIQPHQHSHMGTLGVTVTKESLKFYQKKYQQETCKVSEEECSLCSCIII